MSSARSALHHAVASLLLMTALALAAPAAARSSPEALSAIATSALPMEAREVIVSIRAGGPFQHERDGVPFGNRERLLPSKARGYYHEYTVRTPGERHRGARRIVCGGPVRTPDICYYSADHYQSFTRIRE